MKARPGPKPKRVGELVLDLKRAQGTPAEKSAGTQGRAVFLIGAGCSVSAGIELASGVAKVAVSQLATAYGLADDEANPLAALQQLVDAEKFPRKYLPIEGEPPWGALYSYVFSEHLKHPNEQRELISEIIGEKDYRLNWAHACLGALVEKRFVHTILTTNFDQLALQGVIRTGIVPVVADGLESLNRISPTPRRPQVVHLHGSMHTYELRNSYIALRETETDRGLQVMMMGLLKEASVLVVVGYAGGEEGVMTLLHYAAKALPRMVVYWIAYEDDFDLLSTGAKALLATGENKFFILGQRADDFFNKLVNELGIGVPDWIRRPLDVLSRQSDISFDESLPDLRRLAGGYQARVRYAVENGRREDDIVDVATEHRSALEFAEAAETIEKGEADYASDDDLLALHADSLFSQYRRTGDDEYLRVAIEEFDKLVERTGNKRLPDVITYIEAFRARIDQFDEDDPDAVSLLARMEALARSVQSDLDRSENLREWSLMAFYMAEAVQLQAERERREAEPGDDAGARKQRKTRLDEARQHYQKALPGLSAMDAIKARECKEGLAGALIGLSEYEQVGSTSSAHLREAQTLFREVVGFARVNTPGQEYAGALENLANAIRSMRLKFGAETHNVEAEEKEIIRKALDIYEALEDTDGSQRMRELLA